MLHNAVVYVTLPFKQANVTMIEKGVRKVMKAYSSHLPLPWSGPSHFGIEALAEQQSISTAQYSFVEMSLWFRISQQ